MKTDREKLIEWIKTIVHPYFAGDIADLLLSKGVTIPVRCGECKHNVANWEHDENDITDYTDIVCDYFMTDGMYRADFCSYGERKEITCSECKYLMFSDSYGECAKGHKGIVKPNDSCRHGERKEND